MLVPDIFMNASLKDGCFADFTPNATPIFYRVAIVALQRLYNWE